MSVENIKPLLQVQGRHKILPPSPQKALSCKKWNPLLCAKSGTLYFVQKVEPFTLYLPSPPHPKNSLLQKVVNSPESSVELFGFVVWFDQIDLPFRLNKN
jgi:hypothetical protein